PVQLHVPTFLRGITDVIRIRARQKGLEFTAYWSGSLPDFLLADVTRLREVLFNLLDNAVKFTNRGRVSFDVRQVGLHGRDSAASQTPSENRMAARMVTLRFQVEDTGCGMTSDQLGTIFEPFTQVGDKRQRAVGSGLGLAISSRLVHLMESQIHVRSIQG